MLVVADKNVVAALADGAAPLPVAPDLEAPEVLVMLADLAHTIGEVFAPAAWLIVEDGTIVGLLSLVAPPAAGVIAIGYGVAPSWRGRGVATRAVAELIAVAAVDARIVAVTAETAVANLASQRVLAANGFGRTGERTDPEDGQLIVWRVDLAVTTFMQLAALDVPA